jgi:hypothetical protein
MIANNAMILTENPECISDISNTKLIKFPMEPPARVPKGVHKIQIAPMLDVSYRDFRYGKILAPCTELVGTSFDYLPEDRKSGPK